MRTGSLIMLFFWGTLIYGLYFFFKSKNKTADATLTATYIITYPIVIYQTINNKPIEPWLAMPLAMAGLPWLFAGIHLSEVSKNPLATKSNEFVGFPIKLWLWGGIISIVGGYYLG